MVCVTLGVVRALGSVSVRGWLRVVVMVGFGVVAGRRRWRLSQACGHGSSCTTLLVWSRVISRCPAGNMVRRTGFLPGLTRTNTGSVRGRVVGWRYLMRMPPVYVALCGLR